VTPLSLADQQAAKSWVAAHPEVGSTSSHKMTAIKRLLPVSTHLMQVLFLIAAGYVLNANLRLHSPVLWIRCLACLVLALALWKPMRFRWAGVALGPALYAASSFNPYRIARISAYVQQNYL
jgi:hypothetical protein